MGRQQRSWRRLLGLRSERTSRLVKGFSSKGISKALI
jgi:hypothetical protein